MTAALLLAVLLGSPDCRLPVYLADGEVRCAVRPAVSAFGRVTWTEESGPVSVPESRVDLDRTMRTHERAPRGGSFSLAAPGVSRDGRTRSWTPPPVVFEPVRAEETREKRPRRVGERRPEPPAEPSPPRLSRRERIGLTFELHRTEEELRALRNMGPLPARDVKEAILAVHNAQVVRRAMEEREAKIERLEKILGED